MSDTYTQKELKTARELIKELAPQGRYDHLADEIMAVRKGDLSMQGDRVTGAQLQNLLQQERPTISGTSLQTLLIGMTAIQSDRKDKAR